MEEHFLGDDIPIRFDVIVDGKPATPLQAGADIYDASGRYIAAGPARCLSSGEVRFLLDGDKIDKSGIYTAVFKVTVRGFGEQSHLVKFQVKEPRDGNRRRLETQKLDANKNADSGRNTARVLAK